VTAVIGSANLSKGGLQTNIELSCIETSPSNSEFARDLFAYFRKLERTVGVVPADLPEILKYERRAQVFRKHIKKAEQAAKQEFKNAPSVDVGKLKQWLNQFRTDRNLKQDFQRRVTKYKRARQILNQLADSKPLSRKAFAALYGQLVGRDGVKFWSSGNIHRSRTVVEQQHRQAMKMFRAVKKSIGSLPQDVFDEGLRFAKHVKGIGPNVLTEAMHTWNPARYAAMNKNPLTSLKELGLPEFPLPQSFDGATYAQYNQLITDLAEWCGFHSLGQVDQFLNYIYWESKKARKKTTAS